VDPQRVEDGGHGDRGTPALHQLSPLNWWSLPVDRDQAGASRARSHRRHQARATPDRSAELFGGKAGPTVYLELGSAEVTRIPGRRPAEGAVEFPDIGVVSKLSPTRGLVGHAAIDRQVAARRQRERARYSAGKVT
jgi:hypothetical protein